MVRTHAVFSSIAIFYLVAVLTGASVSSADSDMDLNALPGETPVSRVLDRTITLGDIKPSQETMDQYDAADWTAEQLVQAKRTHWRSNLGGYFQPLFERYAGQSEITVTDADIEQYKQAMMRIGEQQIERYQTIAGSLGKELQANNLDDHVRDELTEQLEMYNSLMKHGEESKEIWQGDGNSTVGTLIRQEIRQWKINQHLYEQYGGRVIFQQAGPEPLDAYRNFLEEREQQGDFEFFNEQAADLFWEYYRNDKMHTFISDVAEAKKMMEIPWWLQEPEETPSQEDMDLWGDCTEGLCVKIKPGKRAFPANRDVIVTMDLLNIGRQTYSCASSESFFEIEVDGEWYEWSGPEPSDASADIARPDTIRYEFATLVLTEQWQSVENKTPLALDEGIHYMRVRYQPMGILPESKTDHQEIVSKFWVTSNLQTVMVIPALSDDSKIENKVAADKTDIDGQITGFTLVKEAHNSREGYDAAYALFEVEYEYNGDEEVWIGGAVYNDRDKVSRAYKPAMIHSGKNVAEVRIIVYFREDEPDTKESNYIVFKMYNNSGGNSIPRQFDYDKVWSRTP